MKAGRGAFNVEGNYINVKKLCQAPGPYCGSCTLVRQLAVFMLIAQNTVLSERCLAKHHDSLMM